MSILDLQRWLDAHCDGDWEHQGGIRIENSDNPGWIISIDFNGIAHCVKPSISERNIEGDKNYIYFNFDETTDQLIIACGVYELEEAVKFVIENSPIPKA